MRRNRSEIGGSYRNYGEDVITIKLKTASATALPSHKRYHYRLLVAEGDGRAEFDALYRLFGGKA
jgi:hypothetical protein